MTSTGSLVSIESAARASGEIRCSRSTASAFCDPAIPWTCAGEQSDGVVEPVFTDVLRLEEQEVKRRRNAARHVALMEPASRDQGQTQL